MRKKIQKVFGRAGFFSSTLPNGENIENKLSTKEAKQKNKMEKEKMKPVGEAGIIMELPESNVPSDILWDLIYAAGKPQVLKYGIDFKVFNHLSMPISAEEVASMLGTQPEPTSRLLDMLVVIGVITKDGGRYVNTPLAEEYLVEGKPTYMGDFYAMTIELNIEGMVAKIPQALKSGIQEMDASQAYPDDFWGRMTDMTARYQRAMWSYKALPMVIEMPEFLSFKRLLDLGGSAGVFTVALVSRHPTLKGIVFDQPSVIETTKKTISEYGLQDRIGVLAGDFTKDDIGNDYDLVRTSDTLSFFPDKKKLEEICKKVYKSMNHGGVFISQQQMVISKNRIWPPDTAWLSHITALAGSDCTLYETDISEAMLKVGFKSVESRYVKYVSGTNREDIARK